MQVTTSDTLASSYFSSYNTAPKQEVVTSEEPPVSQEPVRADIESLNQSRSDYIVTSVSNEQNRQELRQNDKIIEITESRQTIEKQKMEDFIQNRLDVLA